MAELEWTRETTFADHGRSVVASSPGVYEIPDEAVDSYLNHRSGGWERPNEGDESPESGTEDDDSTPEVESQDDLEALPNVGPAIADSLSESEYDSYGALREADPDAVAEEVGNLSASGVEEIQAYLSEND